MMKYLVPVDGSQLSMNAPRHVAKLAAHQRIEQVHLINVRAPIGSNEVRRFMTEDEIVKAQLAEGHSDLEAAAAILQQAGITYRSHVEIGPIAATIARKTIELGCDGIIMSTHGRGGIAALVLGSIASKVIHLVDVPVTLVK